MLHALDMYVNFVAPIPSTGDEGELPCPVGRLNCFEGGNTFFKFRDILRAKSHDVPRSERDALFAYVL